MNLTGKTIYLVKVGNSIIDKSLSLKEAQQTLKDYNFSFGEDGSKGMTKAKLYKATIK